MRTKQEQIDYLEKELRKAEEAIHQLRQQADKDFSTSPLFQEMSKKLKYYELTEQVNLYALEGKIRREKASDEELKRLFADNVELCRKHKADYWIGLTEINRYDKQRIHSLEREVNKLSAQVEARDTVIKHLKDVISGTKTEKTQERPRGRQPIPDDVKKRVRKYRREGYTIKNIAAMEGLSLGYVSGICKDIKKPKKK